MRSIAVVLVTFTVLCAGQSVKSSLSDTSSIRGDTQIIIDPRLEAVRLKGNKLIVTGRDFSDGATIFINNEAVVTRNDSESPTTRLIAKKGGKRIPSDTIVDIEVENPGTPDIGYSLCLSYFRRGFVLTRVLTPGTSDPHFVALHVGDYVFVKDLAQATRWFGDANTLVRVFDVQVPSDEYWSFQAVQPGVFRLFAEVDTRAGAPPAVIYNVPIIVE